MCGTCGCDEQRHEHEHGAGHEHGPSDGARLIALERRILSRNEQLAAANRRWFEERGILALNFVSSPGAGKTTLLERTIGDLGDDLAISVIEGDQATDNDAARIRAAGARAAQINTGTGCHLDATMIRRALDELTPPDGSVVFIENVGNLVCPALFDLGERAKVLVASVTEGEDKPVKYPHMFRAGEVLLLNKIDLAPHVGFDEERFRASARLVQPALRILPLSARSGAGLEEWYGWLRAQKEQRRDRRSPIPA